MTNQTKNVKKYTSAGIGLLLLFSVALIAIISVHSVQASNTIYIRADGSIEPQTANITSSDNVTYTFFDNNYDSLVIERDNIIVDGASFTLKALSGHGIELPGRVNVTMKNMKIERVGRGLTYAYGIYLDESFNNTIFNVNITNNYGLSIYLYFSSYNYIHHNFFENGGVGDYQAIDNKIYNNTFVNTFIELKGNRDWVYNNNFTESKISIFGKYNNVYGNIVAKSEVEGIFVGGEFTNVTGNTITECKYGILLRGHHGHLLRENKMANNTFNFGLTNEEELEIYNDVDVSNTVDGKPIYFWNGVRDETVPLDAGVVILRESANITIKNLDLRKNLQGIMLIRSHNCTILNNTITENGDEGHPGSGGIILLQSSGNLIKGNNITNNNDAGIDLTQSWNNTISENSITKNEIIGIDIGDNSNYTVVSENTFVNNLRGIRLFFARYNAISRNSIVGPGYYGIELGGLYNNITDNDIVYCQRGIHVKSRFHKIIGNSIMENYEVGVYLDYAENNTFYHNNFVDNDKHVSWYYMSAGYNNTWDNGYPSGGNYWSGYEGKYPNATEIDGSGIWSMPYTITEANIDNYPLMAPTKPVTRKFTAYDNLKVEIYSNSSISEFQFNIADKELSFNVTGPTGTRGFCNVTIPANLLWGNFYLFINGFPLVEGVNFTKTYNGTHYTFHITYTHSEHAIEIVGTEVIPEIPSAIILPLLIILSIITVIFAKKKCRKELFDSQNPFF